MRIRNTAADIYEDESNNRSSSKTSCALSTLRLDKVMVVVFRSLPAGADFGKCLERSRSLILTEASPCIIIAIANLICIFI